MLTFYNIHRELYSLLHLYLNSLCPPMFEPGKFSSMEFEDELKRIVQYRCKRIIEDRNKAIDNANSPLIPPLKNIVKSYL